MGELSDIEKYELQRWIVDYLSNSPYYIFDGGLLAKIYSEVTGKKVNGANVSGICQWLRKHNKIDYTTGVGGRKGWQIKQAREKIEEKKENEEVMYFTRKEKKKIREKILQIVNASTGITTDEATAELEKKYGITLNPHRVSNFLRWMKKVEMISGKKFMGDTTLTWYPLKENKTEVAKLQVEKALKPSPSIPVPPEKKEDAANKKTLFGVVQGTEIFSQQEDFSAACADAMDLARDSNDPIYVVKYMKKYKIQRVTVEDM